MNMVSIRTLMTLIVFSLVFSVGFAASAKTPDGETPAEETVCDGLEGAQYGLCTAYCEAMDCDSSEPKASDAACERVRSNFITNAGGGTGPPCHACSICPCKYFDIPFECMIGTDGNRIEWFAETAFFGFERCSLVGVRRPNRPGQSGAAGMFIGVTGGFGGPSQRCIAFQSDSDPLEGCPLCGDNGPQGICQSTTLDALELSACQTCLAAYATQLEKSDQSPFILEEPPYDCPAEAEL